MRLPSRGGSRGVAAQVAGSARPWFSSHMGDKGKAKRGESRDDRLRAALRENLKRRKAQARGRGAATEAETARPDKNGENAGPKRES